MAACLVAYQRKSRGPKCTWYQRKAEKPVEQRLERLYSPRAVWVFPPQHQFTQPSIKTEDLGEVLATTA